ncbi:MAG: hypothetical protein H0T73_00565 [Ardenticatenales bacterium]|nr:hypothetical protein [Ardenticatenales bacterium]
MDITTPSEIGEVAWQGTLEAPPNMLKISPSDRPVVTIGKAEFWSVPDALSPVVGQAWIGPLGNHHYWLARFACTLHRPRGSSTITEARTQLYLRPQESQAGAGSAYAHSLFPERLEAEETGEISALLNPQLTIEAVGEVSVGQVGRKISYRKVFPVIQSFGAGESKPYWEFRPHAARPLEGTQFVYAVLAAPPEAGGVRGNIELIVTVQTEVGPIRLGAPDEAREALSFKTPAP